VVPRSGRRKPSFTNLDRAARARGGDVHRLALRDLAQRLIDKIPGALQVLDPRRGLVVDAALVDERSFAVDHVPMVGVVRAPYRARLCPWDRAVPRWGPHPDRP
jgi:hypothetical protein